MFTPQEVQKKYLHNLHKEYTELTLVEKDVLAVIQCDTARGRYSILLQTDSNKLHMFLDYIASLGTPYTELEDAVRWAVEDVYFEQV